MRLLKLISMAIIISFTKPFFHSYFSTPKIVAKAIISKATTKNILATSRTITQPILTTPTFIKSL